jgi:Rod binding domain-containing protein
MDISAITPQAGLLINPDTKAMGAVAAQQVRPDGKDAKIADSCKQFEAVLWRQMLEKALSPMLHSSDCGGDKTGTYNYFLTNTIADEVSQSSNGISSVLYAQLISKNPTTSKL